MDSKLKFKENVDTVVNQASRMLGFLKRNTKGFLDQETKIILFNSLVRSRLEFASVVWNPQYTTHSQRIESIQRSFTRHMAFHSSGIYHKDTYDLRLKQFGMASLYNRGILLDIIFLKKILLGYIDCADLLKHIKLSVPQKYPRHRITRLLYVPACRTNILKGAPIPRLCSEYNRLTASISDIDIFNDSVSTIRKKLIAHFCSLPSA
ncbi:uncharacterized protein LOC123658011 [Melitaea cinxia]|uniref:uncharacterized protein LOC123658011 n=1 Tax=Melitaea cinxia TaxID=113334 RepID=UPI001E273A42|nr:uncharacterized protein LOC123658011 [Melitaea cinxia]